MTDTSAFGLDLSAVAANATMPSPSAWEDEVFYFLLVDRFSDGKENGYRDLGGNLVAGTTPMYSTVDNGNAVSNPQDAAAWRQAGTQFTGGTLTGIRSKLGYLSRLGVTALWISPVLKQSHTDPGSTANYHGYAIQDFLAVDPHFGTADDLRNLVTDAHQAGMRVILDVVLNHAGDVFAYDLSDPNRYPSLDPNAPPGTVDPRWDGRVYPVAGWRDGHGGLVPFTPAAAAAAHPDGAVFPSELHDHGAFSRLGRIANFDYFPETTQGDFFSLKDIHQGDGPTDEYVPSTALRAITRAYCWWLAFADLDGFRIDTVKHMDPGATRFFTSVIHEFAQSTGKDRFMLVGEDTGSRAEAIQRMELTGLDAALGLADVQYQIEQVAKGRSDPRNYFDLFRNSAQIGKDSPTWLRNTVFVMIDDHDKIRDGGFKRRFCTEGDGTALALAALALNATTLGIPCIYYGSEQQFDGSGGGPDNDRYIREAMFGGSFGAFRSRDRHFFDESAPVHRELSRVLAVRRAETALRRGRQFLRQISGNGVDFGYPASFGGAPILSVLAWSRILAEREVLCAMNTDPYQARTAWVTVDSSLHHAGDTLPCLYHSGPGPHPALNVEARNGAAAQLTIPPGGFVIYG
jgi:glycosidase